jgi:hypothetical protein
MAAHFPLHRGAGGSHYVFQRADLQVRFRKVRATDSKVAEFLFNEACLIQDGAKSSHRHVTSVHRQIGLPPVFVSQNQVRTALSAFLKTGTLQLAQHFFRLVGISGNFHGCEDRLGDVGHRFAIEAFFLVPQRH